jgi:hypothetical protein
MREQQRHGWQICHVLIKNFGNSGKLEARKLLERRAYQGTRLLGAFNQLMEHFRVKSITPVLRRIVVSAALGRRRVSLPSYGMLVSVTAGSLETVLFAPACVRFDRQ